MSQRPMPNPNPRTPPPGGGGWNWEVNFTGLNGLLNAMLSRYQNMADIQIAESEASRPRNEKAFQDWLKKRQFERDMETWRAENTVNRQGEDDRRYDLARGDVEKAQRDAENQCAAMRAQGIPCATPASGGSTYGGSSTGGVPGAKPSMDYGRPATPAWGPTEAYSGGGTTIVNNPNYTSSPGQFVSGGGMSMPSSKIDIPDYWDTNAGGGFDDCYDSNGKKVPCSQDSSGW